MDKLLSGFDWFKATATASSAIFMLLPLRPWRFSFNSASSEAVNYRFAIITRTLSLNRRESASC
jgi:hypothetical protein